MTRITRAVILLLRLVALLLLVSCYPSGETAPPIPHTATRSDDAVQQTTPLVGASDQNPGFSPDGTRLVFTAFENGYNRGPAGLFLLNLSNSQVTRLTPIEDQDNVSLPGAAWDASSDRILFASDRLESDDLWRIAPDGTDLSRITIHSDLPWYIEPSGSPDGEWIVFEASRPETSEDGHVGEIWKVRGNGSGLTQLTGTPGFDDRQPNWSPAGDRILFQRRALPDGQWDIYTIAADGSDLRNVTDDAATADTDASWSPDAACIVYSSDHGGLPVPNLFAIRADGGRPVRITFSGIYADGAPSWSPDGEWIAFESREGQEEDSPSALWRIVVPEGACDETDSRAYLSVTVTAQPRSDVLAVNDFVYQLQNLDLIAIGNTAYDLVVMDYSTEGDDESAFTAAQIAALKDSPGGPKVVLAYMSIGEAEDYRFYWQEGWEPGNPSWFDEENADWPGNYKVHYWDPAWQAIILDYTDRLLGAGFDGTYLDIIDAYEYATEQGRANAAPEMASFVATIRAHAHARDPDFLIFAQNAPELASLVPTYLDSVDGIGQEDIYYGYNDDGVMTPFEITIELERYLDALRNAGKLVLTVDYATRPAHVDDAYAKSLAKGYVPFVTVRDLDRLTVNPGHEPD